MRVVYTPEASDNLDTILAHLFLENPSAAFALARMIDAAVSRISDFPESSPVIDFDQAVRVVTLMRFPYRIFYRVKPDVVEILHIRHTSREPWAGGR